MIKTKLKSRARERVDNAIGIIIAVSIIAFIFYYAYYLITFKCFETSSEPRLPISNSNLQPLFSVKLELPEHYSETGLILTDTHILVGIPSCGGVSFDLNSQILAWENKYLNIMGMTHQVKDGRSYSTGYQLAILSYDVNTGKIIWKNDSIKQQRTVITLQVNPDDEIIAYTSQPVNGYSIYHVDPDEGTLTPIENLPDNTILYYDDIALTQYFRDLTAFDIETNQSIWEYRLPIAFYRFKPNIQEGFIIVDSSYLQIVDWETGQLVWKYDQSPIASNIFVDDRKAYFLDMMGEFHIHDLYTGQLIDTIQFPAFKRYGRFRLTNYGLAGSRVEVKGNKIAIYFGDKHELTVYDLLASEN